MSSFRLPWRPARFIATPGLIMGLIMGLTIVMLAGCGGDDSSSAPGGQAETGQMGPPIAMSAGSPGGSPSASDEHGLVPVEISGIRVTAEDLGLRIRLTRCTQRRGGIQVELSIVSLAADRRIGPSGPPEQPTRLYKSGRRHTVDDIVMDGALIRSARTAVPVRAGKPSELELEFQDVLMGDDEVDALDLWITVDGVPRGFRFEAITIE